MSVSAPLSCGTPIVPPPTFPIPKSDPFPVRSRAKVDTKPKDDESDDERDFEHREPEFEFAEEPDGDHVAEEDGEREDRDEDGRGDGVVPELDEDVARATSRFGGAKEGGRGCVSGG